jgi:tRNA nucleotidyltransferase (CCA-adding enzyme)
LKIYLLGGAVRDELMGRSVKERDYVVVEGSVEEMTALGYGSVGKDFPVFLHPKTKEEYALARTERKVSGGYHGFEFDTSRHVTLEEDLKRRDLTINAIAKSETGEIIDPYNGRNDLENKVLRHVSEAFVEDPVRVLRVARFAARFHHLGFTIAPETLSLMANMVKSGECDYLVPERIWKELSRALEERNPEVFFEVLHNCGALMKILPEVKNLKKYNEALIQACKDSVDLKVRFAAFLQYIQETELKKITDRLKLPNDYRDLAFIVIKNRESYSQLQNNAEKLLQLLEQLDAFRRSARLFDFIAACVFVDPAKPRLLKRAYEAAARVDLQKVIASIESKDGEKIKQAVREARRIEIEKITTVGDGDRA